MTRSTPRLFLRHLRELGVDLAPKEPGAEIRPRKLFRALSRRGFEIEQTKPTAAVLRGFGFQPESVIDIGVDQGTPMIYDAFPQATFLLVDPLIESRQKVQKYEGKLDFQFECCALGPEDGIITVNIPSTATKTRTSRATAMEFEGRNKAQFASFETREVPMRRLDSLTADLQGPIGIKIDTEGFELEVMKGATETLKRTEFVLAEANVKRRYVGGYRFSELVSFMGQTGFEILDFPRPIRPDSDDCDVLFARYDSARFDF